VAREVIMARPMTNAQVRWGNLPAEVDSFIGRRREVIEVRRLLSQTRLVTLTGAGGVGKSRLARRVAAGLQEEFPDGAWLVDLAKLSAPELVSRAVAEALRIPDQSSRDPLVILTDHMRDRRMLLVLDNCEHLLRECKKLADALLASAPELRILATSRQGLYLADEQIMVVPPMSLPAVGHQPPTAALEQFGAVVLFADRAAAAQPGFTLTELNQEAVIDICRRVDGIPLAIELAAVQLRSMPPEQLRELLDNRYRLLASGRRDIVAHHQSLRSLIDWSFELCSPPEQLFWARSSVFVGSFDLAAAQDICATVGIRPEDVPRLVDSLVDKSILVREEGSRYRMLETIRQYGRDHLAKLGEEDSTRARHCDFYRRVAAQTAREAFGPSQVDWFRRLQRDHDDLRAALEYCATEPRHRQPGLQLAADLLYHWISSYFVNEGRSWLDRLLAIETAPSAARIDALWSNSWVAIIQQDIPAAQSMLAEARSLAEERGASVPLGYIALYSGMAAMFAGDTDAALDLYAEARARNRETGNNHGLAMSLIRSSMAYSSLGDTQRAMAFGEECLAVCDAAGDIWHKSYMLTALGIAVWREGDTRRAAAFEQESLRLNQALDDWLGIVLNLEMLVLTAAADREYQRAARLLGALQSQRRAVGVSMSGYTHLSTYHDEYVERIRKHLDEQQYEALIREGAELTLEQTVSLALQEKRERTAAPTATPRLTRREQEIAELVAEGLSNKEIAEKLVIAQRTAEGHVQNILVKLGFTARAQITAWVAEHRRSAEI
jgi:predicted ATPase/DNA-binding NarL/FixJ family response regulator